jgi:hypothetical protein
VNQITYEDGYARVKELAEAMTEARNDRNEATTRLQLIDRLLFECLGWSRDDLGAEDYGAGEYADYVMPARRRRLVLEAKREGATFELPEGLGERAAIEALLGLGGTVEAAIQQAKGYAQKRGAPYAAICNGHQLLAFIASRQDGVDPDRGRALVFADPAAMVERFASLWENLGPLGTSAMTLSRTLGTAARARPPKLAETIADYPGTATSEDNHYMLATLNVLFLPAYVRDDAEEDHFLTECYCPPGAHSSLAMLNRSILRTRYSLALGRELGVGLAEAQDKDGLDAKLRDEVAASSAGREPLVLLGDVGVDKTMFLRRLLRVDAKEIAERAIVLYVDLGRDAVIGEIGPHVASAFKRQLLERYDIDIDEGDFMRGTYQAEVARFARGIYGELAKSDAAEFRRRQIEHLAELARDTEEHLRRSLTHLVKLRRQQVIVVLDNIDQRLQPDQEAVFLIAESIAKNWPCTVFVSLRPATFNASRVDGTLSGYQPRAFTVQPPRVELVVAKRLDFGATHYEREGRLPQWLGWTAESDDLRDYLQILRRSFKRSEALKRTLVNLSGANTRRALELMKTFLASPHGQHQQTLIRDRRSRNPYLVPPYAFLKAALVGDGEYYSPEASRIPNLFDIATRDPREHFLLGCLIALLDRDAERRDKEGYMTLADLYGAFGDAGFTAEQIDFALGRAIAGAWVDVLPPEANGGSVRSVRATTVGIYGYRVLAGQFEYLDAVVLDTPITDAELRHRIRDVRAVVPRLQRAETLLTYLDACWAESGLADLGAFDWPEALSGARADIELVRSKLN